MLLRFNQEDKNEIVHVQNDGHWNNSEKWELVWPEFAWIKVEPEMKKWTYFELILILTVST